jgi:phosphoribosylformimino-5-aminoimidazole carboxamide ribonucleotide (ProFAR) isomerase
VEASPWPVWISGGVTTLDELEWLDQAGAHAVVLGMAIYTDTLDRGEVAARWGRAVAGDSNERPERGTR